MSDTPRTDWKEEMYWADPNGHAADVWKWVRELEQENAELKAWRESALAVEREWDAQAIATMLGAKPGESCRKVVAREVPKLVAENAALRAELAPLRETVGVRGDATTCREDIYYWSKLVARSDSAIRLERENAELRKDVYCCPPTSENSYEGFKWSDACEELENENAALRNEVARLNNQTNWVCSCGGTDCAGQKENAVLRKQLEDWQQSTQWFADWAEKKQELERENVALADENSRLHVELDAYHNGEQLRVLRAENEALRKEKDRLDWLITSAPFCVLSTLSSDPAAARLKIDREMEFPTV